MNTVSQLSDSQVATLQRIASEDAVSFYLAVDPLPLADKLRIFESLPSGLPPRPHTVCIGSSFYISQNQKLGSSRHRVRNRGSSTRIYDWKPPRTAKPDSGTLRVLEDFHSKQRYRGKLSISFPSYDYSLNTAEAKLVPRDPNPIFHSSPTSTVDPLRHRTNVVDGKVME